MPAVKKFAPSLHPRDHNGRFTRSRSAEASLAEKNTAGEVASGLKPKKGVGGAKAGPYLRTVGGGQHDDTVKAYTSGGYVDTHKALRAGVTDEPSVKAMDAAMVDLPDDLIVSRRVPNSAFGPDGPQALVGLKVRDAAYSPTGIGTVRATKGDVRIRYAVPAGTRAAVDADSGEVILDRDLEAVVAKVEPNSVGGFDMYVTVLPKAGAKGKLGKADADAAKADKPTKPEADKPEGGNQVRADLMKLKVPELQAQMRERGLKPGKKRKSELVDALVADEVGADGKAESKPASAAPAKPAADTSVTPVTGQDALDAPPLSMSAKPRSSDLTTGMSRALYTYGGAEYAAVNRSLRKQNLPYGYTQDDVTPVIAGIDQAMKASVLDRPIIVHRGVTNATPMFGDRLDGDLTGMQWREDAFVSTSANEKLAGRFGTGQGQPMLMNISAPAGTSAIELSSMDLEGEILLDRGHAFTVTKDRGVVDGVRHIDVQVGPKETNPAPAAVNTAKVEPSAGWQNARSGDDAFIVANTISQSGARLVLDRTIKQRDKARVQQSAVSYGQDPRDGDLNYVTINAAIRGQGGGINPSAAADIEQTVTDLDLLLTASPLRVNTVTYRGLQSPTAALPGWRDDADNTGLEWTAEGYQSTTTDERVAYDFASGMVAGGTRTTTPTVARVLVPKGTPGLQMSPVVSEILLPRNQRFRVVADRGIVGGVRQVDIELIPEGDANV